MAQYDFDLFAIGAGSQLVGVTKNCNYPPEAEKLPRVGGGTLESLSREVIISLQPDLVLCRWDHHQPLMETLEQFNIQTLALGPETFAPHQTAIGEDHDSRRARRVGRGQGSSVGHRREEPSVTWVCSNVAKGLPLRPLAPRVNGWSARKSAARACGFRHGTKA